MFKKFIPLVLMLVVSACANMGSTSNAGMKMACCEKGDCCKGGQCACCEDGSCKTCMKDGMSAMKEGEDCPVCDKANREWKAKQKHGTMKH